MKFNAMQVSEDNKTYIRKIIQRDTAELPEGDVLIKVSYSSLNYKDALSATGNRGVTRNYPHTPGIDAAGIVTESSSSDFKAGDEVIATGHDLGMNTSGGFAEYIRVPAEWVIKLPEGLTLKESMIYGTAGFTAALSVYKLIKFGEITPDRGEILVTGARGGVGSHAVGFLSKAGYNVVAATGILKDQEKDFARDKEFLLGIGASRVIRKEDIDDTSGKAMLKQAWSGVIDTVGGNILSTVIRQAQYSGAVTSCGNAGGPDFYASVYPFIIRGVTLFGIDSVECPMNHRKATWQKMATEWKYEKLHDLAETCSLAELDTHIDSMLKGILKKRRIIDLSL